MKKEKKFEFSKKFFFGKFSEKLKKIEKIFRDI